MNDSSMNATQCIVSIGELCDRYQAPLSQLERAFASVRPVISINGIPYFDEAEAQSVAKSIYPSPAPTHQKSQAR